VVYTEPSFRLPLVHHLVQERVLYLRPGMPGDVSAADDDLVGAAGLEINLELTQAASHPT